MDSHPIILEDPEDNLFDDLLMKKFMKKSHSKRFSETHASTFILKKVEPAIINFHKTSSRKKIEMISPSKTRVSFFTQQNP